MLPAHAISFFWLTNLTKGLSSEDTLSLLNINLSDIFRNKSTLS